MAPPWEFSEYMFDGANSLLYFGKIFIYRRAIIKETAWNNLNISFFGAWQYQIPLFGNNTTMFCIFNNYGIGSAYQKNHIVPITSTYLTQAGRKGVLQILLVKEFQLEVSSKKVYSVSVLWNILLSFFCLSGRVSRLWSVIEMGGPKLDIQP